MGDTWITDMTHFLDVRNPAVAHRIPAPARRLAEHLGSIVEAVTAGWNDPGGLVASMVRCRRRPGRKPCPGLINAHVTEVPAEIRWECENCDDNGVIRNWQGTPWDLSGVSRIGEADDEDLVFMDLLVREAEYDAIRSILVLDDVAERVVKAARGVGDGDVLLEAPRARLEHLLEAVAAEANHTRSPKRRELLGGVVGRTLSYV